MTKRIVFALAAMLAVAGCSAQAPSPSTVGPAPTPQAAPTGAGATMQVTPANPTASPSAALSALADQYTAIADKANAQTDKCSKDMTAAGNDLTMLKAAAAECLTAYNLFEAEIGAAQWGPVQPQVNDVIKAEGTVQLLFGEMAQASDITSLTTAANQLTAAEGNLVGAVNVLRAALGLPPAQVTAS